MSHVVVVGGGIGGIAAVSELRRGLDGRHRITLIDKGGTHVFQPDFLWVMMGWRRPERIQRDLHGLARHGIDVMTAEVRGLGAVAHRIQNPAGPVDYDRLVLAPGAELAPSSLEGFLSDARNLYTLEGVLQLREDLATFRGGEEVVLISSPPLT